MTALTWSALSFFLFVLVGGTVGLAVVVVDGWRALRGFRRGALAELTAVGERVAALEARVGGLGERADELQRSVARLNRSLARARVLLLGVHDVQGLIAAVRAFVPRK